MYTNANYIFICLIFLVGGCIQKPNSVYKPTYLDSTRKMAMRGEYQKALDRYLWFHNHILEHDSAMRGVRLSFALSYWKELGESYPPAMTALKEDRDRKTEQIILQGNLKQFFEDVVAINSTLNENNKTIELFEIISSKYPLFATEVVRYALEDLLAAKRYDLIKKNVIDLMEHYNRIESIYRGSFEEIGNSDQSLKSFMEKSFVDKVVELILYSVAIDDKINATKIQTKALVLVNDNRIKKAIVNK